LIDVLEGVNFLRRLLGCRMRRECRFRRHEG
jgi:hypothetical protein